MSIMNFLIWNTRGAASVEFKRTIKDLISTYKMSLLMILEPHISGAKDDKLLPKFFGIILFNITIRPKKTPKS